MSANVKAVNSEPSPTAGIIIEGKLILPSLYIKEDILYQTKHENRSWAVSVFWYPFSLMLSYFWGTAVACMRKWWKGLMHLIILSLGFSFLWLKKCCAVPSLLGNFALEEAVAGNSECGVCSRLFFRRWAFRKVVFLEITRSIRVKGDRPCTSCGFLCSRMDVWVPQVALMNAGDFPEWNSWL